MPEEPENSNDHDLEDVVDRTVTPVRCGMSNRPGLINYRLRRTDLSILAFVDCRMTNILNSVSSFRGEDQNGLYKLLYLCYKRCVHVCDVLLLQGSKAMIILNRNANSSGFLILLFVLNIAGCSCDLKNESTEDVSTTSAESKSNKKSDRSDPKETSVSKNEVGPSGNSNQQTLTSKDVDKNNESSEISGSTFDPSGSIGKSKSKSSPIKPGADAVTKKSSRASGIPAVESSNSGRSSIPGQPDRTGATSNRSGRGRSTDVSPSGLGEGSSDLQSVDGEGNGSGIPKKDEERPKTTRFRKPS